MRRPPYTTNFTTRGYSALREALSITTKGYLDTKVGGKPVPSMSGFTLIFDIVGTKEFALQEIYQIIGQRQYIQTQIFALNGIKQFSLTNIYDLTGIRSRLINTSKEIWGTKQFQLDTGNRFSVQGIKAIGQYYNWLLTGTKQFDVNVIKEMIGIKQIGMNLRKPIRGIKKMNHENVIMVEGKRDLTPIHTALAYWLDSEEDEIWND